MKLNQLLVITDAVEKIAEQTGTTALDVVEALTGLAWDEEDGNIILRAIEGGE